MATLATSYDSQTIEHNTIRWNEDLTGAQRAAIASEVERDRFIPEFKWVKVGQLYVDESYQRPLSQPWVWDIATSFSWAYCETLWIGSRGGKLYVVDGRHRLAAVSILGTRLISEVPCAIRRTQSVQEEAEIYVGLQEKRKRISSAQRFKAKLLRKDPMALDIQRIMARYKFTVDTDGFSLESTDDQIQCIGLLESFYRAGGKNRLDGVLLIIREAWNGVYPTTSARILRAVNRMLEREPGKNPETLARKLRSRDPWGLIERGERFGHSNEIPASEAIADVFLEVVK